MDADQARHLRNFARKPNEQLRACLCVDAAVGCPRRVLAWRLDKAGVNAWELDLGVARAVVHRRIGCACNRCW